MMHYSAGDQEQLLQLQPIPASSAVSLLNKSSFPPLGKPTVKKRIHIFDLLAVGVSLICLAVAVIAVADESVSWRLGVGTNQLIVLGFLLSMMNLCLAGVASGLFLLIEARFGRSTIQNYDGILRNQVFATRLSGTWRLVLGFTMALPIGLSVAYKRFSGGESVMQVNVTTYTGNSSYYGMFAPPGLQSLGEIKGITLFFNATLAFAVASAPSASANLPNIEPTLPTGVQPYGYNILLLSNESTAILDIPQPSYILAVQSLLAVGESWNLTAPVLATVASFNHSKEEDPDGWNATFLSACSAAGSSSGAYSHQSMLNGWAVYLMDNPSPGNQSQQYIGLGPDPGVDYILSCSTFSSYAQLYDVTRQQCEGTWSITRGGIQLVEGSCNGTMLPQYQIPITDNILFLGVWYMSSLMEFLGPFATTRNQSAWAGPYFATATAAMLWSRIAALDTAPLANDQPLVDPQWRYSTGNYGYNFTNEEVGLIYPVNDSVIYIRPTLRKSGMLYAVLSIQPLLLVIMLGLSIMFHSTPLDKGFGLISILAGIDRGSLDTLAGAALSGELREDVKLVISPLQEAEKGSIEYYVMPSSEGHTRNGTLVSGIVYY
jgi:hypothetical protein